MKISGYTNFNIKQQTFKAGKTTLYTDFDGTYFPYVQEALRCNDELTLNSANNMYSAFRTFKTKAKDKFSTIITTGRSRLEMKTVLKDIANAGVVIQKPDGYIFRDGTDTLNKTDKNLEKSVNKDFLNDLNTVKNKVKDIDKKTTIIKSSTNKNIHNDEKNSLEALFKNLPIAKRNKYVSIAVENDKMIELAFPPSIDTDVYEDKIREYYEEKQIPVRIVSYKNDRHYWVPVQNGVSKDGYDLKPGNIILIKYPKDGVIPDKLNQPKNAVKKIVENNTDDLIIVAGDASNDRNMLNPLNYIDIFGVEKDDGKPVEELLNDEEVLSAIKKLPLVSIIAGNGDNLGEIVKIKKILDSKKIRKIFIARNSDKEFLAKIKNGMYSYGENNVNYKYGMGMSLYGEILE